MSKKVLRFDQKVEHKLIYTGKSADGSDLEVDVTLVEGQYGNDPENLRWNADVAIRSDQPGSPAEILESLKDIQGHSEVIGKAAAFVEAFRKQAEEVITPSNIDAAIARGREILTGLSESKVTVSTREKSDPLDAGKQHMARPTAGIKSPPRSGTLDEVQEAVAACPNIEETIEYEEDRRDVDEAPNGPCVAAPRDDGFARADHTHPAPEETTLCEADTVSAPREASTDSKKGGAMFRNLLNPREGVKKLGRATLFSGKIAAIMLVGYTLGFKAHETGIGPAPGTIWDGVKTVAISPLGVEVWEGDWTQTKVGPTGNTDIHVIANPDGTKSYFDPASGSRDIKIMFTRNHYGLFGNCLRTETKNDPGWGEAGRQGGNEIVTPPTVNG